MDIWLTIFLLADGVAEALLSSSNQLISRRSSTAANSRGLGIFDGTNTTIQKRPYLVAQLIHDEFNCAACIVSERWVVTSGDCASFAAAKDTTVVAGSSDYTNGTVYQVVTIVLHPRFDYSTFDYDYACLQIQGSFQWSNKVKPAKLPSRYPKANTRMMVAGWGNTSAKEDGGSGRSLMQGMMKWLAPKACKSIFKSKGVTPWVNRFACAYNEHKTTLCDMDWGDPFVKNGVFYGQFIAAVKKSMCTEDAKAVLLANIYTVVNWMKNKTDAKYEEV